MKSLRKVGPLLAAFILLGPISVGQSTGWQALREVPEGSKIKVTPLHKRTFGHCVLMEVTDEWLDCHFNLLGPRRYTREEICTVSLGHHSMRTGFLVGAGAGAVLGAATGNGGSSGRVLTAIILAPVLGGVGAGVGGIVDPILPERVIYRCPDPNHRNDTVKPRPADSRPAE